MKVLLDTQVFLWMMQQPDRLAAPSRALLEGGATELYFSSASAWEIAIKHSAGKLRLPGAPEVVVLALMHEKRISPLPVSHGHALRVAHLPRHHRDPFDRLLVAQAQVEGLPILTADAHFAAYDVEVIAA